jgi:hypothetical protein
MISSIFCGLLYWQVSRLVALENAVNVTCSAPILIEQISSVRDKTAVGDKGALDISQYPLSPGHPLGLFFAPIPALRRVILTEMLGEPIQFPAESAIRSWKAFSLKQGAGRS